MGGGRREYFWGLSKVHLEQRQDILAGSLLLLFQRPAIRASQERSQKNWILRISWRVWGQNYGGARCLVSLLVMPIM